MPRSAGRGHGGRAGDREPVVGAGHHPAASAGGRREERRAGRIGELSVAGSVVPAAAEVVAAVRLDSIAGGIEVAASIRRPVAGRVPALPAPAERRAALRGARAVPAPRPSRGRRTPTRTPIRWRATISTCARWCGTPCLLELPLAPLCREDCRGLCPSAEPTSTRGLRCRPRWMPVGALDVLRAAEEDGARPWLLSGHLGRQAPGRGESGGCRTFAGTNVPLSATPNPVTLRRLRLNQT